MTVERIAETGDSRQHWLDYARLLAALAVLLFHYYAFGPSEGHIGRGRLGDQIAPVAAYGYHGVELFFMISGFVIMMSVNGRSAADFTAARIRRLYPAFVVCMTATTLALAAMPNAAFPVSPGKYLANLTLLAPAFGETYIDAVYWTLVKELQFYAAVALVLLLGLRERLEQVVWVWLGLRALAVVVGWEAPLVGDVFELFIAGCLLYFGTMRGWTIGRRLAAMGALVLVIEGIVRRGQFVALELGLVLDPLVLAMIGPAFFSLFLVLGRSAGRWPLAQPLGALTYPLYLLHNVLGYLVIVRLSPALGVDGAVLVTAALMIASAWFVARFVEQVPRRLWTRLAVVAASPIGWLETRLATLQSHVSSPSRGND